MCGWSLLEKCIAWRSACHSVCGRRIDFPSPPDDFIIIIVGGALHAAINLSPTHHLASIFSSFSSIHIFRWLAASLKKLEFYRNLNYSAHSRVGLLLLRTTMCHLPRCNDLFARPGGWWWLFSCPKGTISLPPSWSPAGDCELGHQGITRHAFHKLL